MQRQFSVVYNFLFSAAVCGVCAIFVSSSAVSLEERQDVNKLLDKKKNVLQAAGFMQADEVIPPAEVEERFASFRAVVIDLKTGEEAPEVEPRPSTSRRPRRIRRAASWRRPTGRWSSACLTTSWFTRSSTMPAPWN